MRVDVLVVGAGPAGLSAASAASKAGASVMVADESFRPGGQYLHPRLSARAVDPVIEEAKRSGASFTFGSAIWHIDPDARVAMLGEDEVRYGALVIATGGYDRTLPVTGRHLRGVLTAGAAQALSKDGARVGDLVLIAGSGPFAFPVAEEILRVGGSVAEVALSHWPRMIMSARHEPRIVPEALHYGSTLVRNRVRVRAGWVLHKILGTESVEGAVLVRRRRDGQAAASRIVQCDAVAMGYGFLPQLALADIAGCALRFDLVHRTWFIRVTGDLETSVPGVFAAGEGIGIGGHRKAIWEGRLAGYRAAAAAGKSVFVPSTVVRNARRLQRFAANAASALAPPAAMPLPDEGAMVCRCEGVAVGQIFAAVDDGARTVSGVRTRTRSGMGPCQGRMCSQICAELVARRADLGVDSAGRIVARTPARPLRIGDLA